MTEEIIPDQATMSVSGYYSIPPIWVCRSRSSPHSVTVPDEIIPDTIFKLQSGVTIKVTGDGDFLFDFFDYPPAAPVFLPGYKKILERGFVIPKNRRLAEQKIYPTLVKRVSILNVYQMLLYNRAEILQSYIGWPEVLNHNDVAEGKSLETRAHNSSAYRWRFHAEAAYRKAVETTDRHISRRVLAVNVVEAANEDIDKVLINHNLKDLLILEEVYYSMTSYMNGRNGPAVAGLWTVIEQLILRDWRRSYESYSKKRKDKLSSTSYTISIIIESMLFQNYITLSLYENIERARSSRNKWMHSMQDPKGEDVQACIRTVKELVAKHLCIELQFSSGLGWGHSHGLIKNDHRMLERHKSDVVDPS